MKNITYLLGVIISFSLLIASCQKQHSEIESPDAILKAKMAKIMICHLTGNGDYNIIDINKNALPAHLAHGDMVVFGQVGTYNLDFLYNGSHHLHEMYITESVDGSFSGTGYKPIDGTEWTVEGTIEENGNYEFRIDYNHNNYYVIVTGIFECGTAYNGSWGNASQSGTWTGTYVVD